MMIVERLHIFRLVNVCRPDSDSPVLNRSKNAKKGRLKFELVGKCSRYLHMTYSQNLVCSVSQSTNINMFTYQW